MSGEGGAIAEVLAAHLIGYEPRAYPAYVCYCGWDGAQGDDGSETDGQYDNADGANEHIATALLASPALAALLAAERQRGRAEALRQAAKEAEERGDIGKEGGYEAWDWLAIRADQAASIARMARRERGAMAWRAIWTPPGTPFPEHSDHETEADAHGFALRKSRETGGEVAVVPIESEGAE